MQPSCVCSNQLCDWACQWPFMVRSVHPGTCYSCLSVHVQPSVTKQSDCNLWDAPWLLNTPQISSLQSRLAFA